MEKNKNSNFLYFNSQELEKEETENKQVFITKRMKGKETHNIKKQIKAENIKENKTKNEKEDKKENDDLFIDIQISQKHRKNVVNKENEKIKNKQKKSKNKQKTAKNGKKATKNKEKIVKQKHKEETKNTKNKTKNKKTKDVSKKKNIGTKIFIVILLIISITIFMFVTPIFNITEISVIGNEKVSEDTIISLSGLKTGENIFKNIKTSITKNIKENAYIDNVEIKRKLPDVIEINIEERKILYQIKIMDSFVYIDKNGYILEKSSKQENAIFIEGYATQDDEILQNKRLNNDDLTKLNDIQKIIVSFNSAQINETIEKVDISNNKDYMLYIKNNKIYIGDTLNLSKKMGYIQMILNDIKDENGSIFINGDLNNGFKPYFRPNE